MRLTANISDRQKKRRRPAKSCEPCRARKVKCDQTYPCRQCTKARAALKCMYAPETIRNLSREPKAATEPGRAFAEQEESPENLCSRIARLEAILAGKDGSVVKPADIQSLQTRVHAIEQRLSTTAVTYADGKTRSSDLDISPIAPSLRIVSEKTKIFPQNHWVHAAKQLATMRLDNSVELTYDAPKAGFAKAKQEFCKLRATIKASEIPALDDPVPDLISTLPAREVCDGLLNTHLAAFEVIYRIIQVPTFLQDYQTFWADPTTSSPIFRLKLVLMLGAATSLHPQSEDTWHLQRLSRTWIYAAQWWLMGPREKSSFNMDSIQIACLLQVARLMTGLGRAWVTSGFLLQLSMATGLHLDPDNFSKMPGNQAEIRRSLWWTVLELTLLAANDTAAPAALELTEYDTKPPQAIDDSSGTLFGSTPLHVFLCETFKHRLRASRLVQRTGSNQSYAETMEVTGRLKEACAKLARLFSETSNREDDTGEQRVDGKFGLSEFHHQFLDIQLRRYIMALHRPFVIAKRHDPKFYASRKICLESALLIGRYAKKANIGPSFGRLNTFFQRTTGSLKGPLSLDVITMLGLELLTQLEENSRQPNDPARHYEKMSRDQIFETLTAIAQRLRERIATGAPKLKAYGLTMTMINQFRAMEKGESSTAAVGQVILDELDSLRQTMQHTIDTLCHDDGQGPASHPELNQYPELDFGMDFNFDFDFDLDIPGSSLPSWHANAFSAL